MSSFFFVNSLSSSSSFSSHPLARTVQWFPNVSSRTNLKGLVSSAILIALYGTQRVISPSNENAGIVWYFIFSLFDQECSISVCVVHVIVSVRFV